MNAKTAPGTLDRIAWALLCAFVFTLPWEKGIFVPGVGSISRAVGMLALAAGAAAAFRRGRLRFPNLALLLAAAFVFWTALTRFWSLAPAATEARAATFVQLLALLWLVWELCRTPKRETQLMAAYVLGTVPSAAATIARYVENQQTYWRRYATAGFDPNDLGMTLALSLPLALYLAFRARNWTQWLWRGTAALSMAAIVLTASRTALIASVAAFVFVALTWRASGRSQKISSAVLLLLLLANTVQFAPSASRARLATLPDELAKGNLHNRTRIWKAGVKVWRHHPILGVGSGAYPEGVRPLLGRPPIAGHEYVAHNTFLSVLVETGLPGFAMYALFLATLAIFVWMMPPPERAVWSVSLAIWAIGVSTLTWEHRKPAWLLFGLIITSWSMAFRGGETVHETHPGDGSTGDAGARGR